MNKIENDDQSGESGESGKSGGGVAGKIKFDWEVLPVTKKLPPGEVKRILAALKQSHLEKVRKERIKRKDRKALKEGKRTNQYGAANGYGYGGGPAGNNKKHPILGDSAQFSGMIDHQVTPVPDENTADTNPEQRNENKNELTLGLRLAPTNTPKPRPNY